MCIILWEKRNFENFRTTTTQSTTPARPTSLGTYLPLKQHEECGYSLAAGYIVGGSLALAGEFPYAVVLGKLSVLSTNWKIYIFHE